MLFVVLGVVAFLSLPTLMLWYGFRQFDKKARRQNEKIDRNQSHEARHAKPLSFASIVGFVSGAIIGGFAIHVLGMALLVAIIGDGSGDGAVGLGAFIPLAIPFGAATGAIIGFNLSRKFF